MSPNELIGPSPRMPMHAADVADAHAAVRQSASPNTAVTVVSKGEKFVPLSVTLAANVATL